MLENNHLLGSFTEIKKIGEGTYGTVYRAKNIKNGSFVAMKKIRLTQGEDGVPSTCLREIFILKELSHQNIVSIQNVILHKDKRLYIIFEYIDQDLKMLLEKISPRPLPLYIVKSFVFQLLQALAYCHAHRVMHRDLKPQNLLVSNNGLIKLADFGLARAYSIPSRCYTHEVLTLWYRAPEILLGARYYSPAVDVWSLGCIFAELVIGKSIFPGDSEIDQLFRIFQVLGTPDSSCWKNVEMLPAYKPVFPKWKKTSLLGHVPGLDDDGIDLLEKMVIYSPLNRITAKMALSHRYLWNVPLNLCSIQELIKDK